MAHQLQHFSRQLLLAQEDERKRISRELHDEIVQILLGIHIHLESLSAKIRLNQKDFKEQIKRTKSLVRKSVNIVHQFARDLRPMVLDDLGLIPALRSFFRDFQKRTKINVCFKAFAGIENLKNIEQLVIYRVIQSALVNVDKHAEASEVKVTILKQKSAIRLDIQDNGKSFEVEKVLFAKRHKRLGLLISRERVEMVGGTFSVKSAPGEGTIVSAEVPINNKVSHKYSKDG